MSLPFDATRLRAFVLEDEWVARNYLVELLQASALVEVIGAVATVDEARQALQPPLSLPVDAVFVDVQLAGKVTAGLELVRSLTRASSPPMFVLATAFREHAVEAFDLGVVDYLLKPFTEKRVEQSVRRLSARRARSHAPALRRIVARRGKSIVFLQPDEVWAFEAFDRLTRVHASEGTFDIDLSLASIETSFGRALLRVHRNWLVNSDHVRELSREGGDTKLFVGLGSGAEKRGLSIPVSRERAQSIREELLADATGLRETPAAKRA